MSENLLSGGIKVSRKVFRGEVVSDVMDKTVVVKVYRTFKDPLIGKTIRRYKKYKAHDKDNAARVGDVVRVAECRPLSKTKHMVLIEIQSHL